MFNTEKIAFNHGWLVQGEAPAGALFSRFKAVIDADQASQQDVSFYFVHWLTDLAGAVPTPLNGADKFVLQFPRAVLKTFLESFPIINKLATDTELNVWNEYLTSQWRMFDLGETPPGKQGVAIMRLTLHMQTTSDKTEIVKQFANLNEITRAMLGYEMSLSGIEGDCDGPSFIVYYSPAFMRTGASEMKWGLLMLAEIYEKGRGIWPYSKSASAQTVIIRIDVMKNMKYDQIVEKKANGVGYFLIKRNAVEAVVEEHPLADAPNIVVQGKAFQLSTDLAELEAKDAARTSSTRLDA